MPTRWLDNCIADVWLENESINWIGCYFLQFGFHIDQFKWRIEPRSSDEDKIVGGSFANKNEFPFIISLRQVQPASWWESASYRHICGGSIISNTRVLTAAHCTVNFKASELNIAAGQHKTNSDTDDQTEQTSDITDA